MREERMRREESRVERRRAGSAKRDALHRSAGEFSTIVIPEGVNIFRPRDGVYRIDIIPYEVGEGNPYAEKGLWYYERTFWIHRGVGVENESFVCMAKTFGEPCAVCEYRAKLARNPEADEAVIYALKPRERQLWLIYDRGEPDKGVQLWETSYYTFGRMLEMRRQGADEDEDYIKNFDDWRGGATLRVMFKEEDAGGYSYLRAVSIEFKERPNGIDESLLNHGICLDSLVKKVDYDYVKRVLRQLEESSVEVEENGLEIELGSEVFHDEFGACRVVQLSKDGSVLVLRDKEGRIYRDIPVEEVSLCSSSPKVGKGRVEAFKSAEREERVEKKVGIEGKGKSKVEEDFEGEGEDVEEGKDVEEEDDWGDDWN